MTTRKGRKTKLPLQLDPMVTSRRNESISIAAEPHEQLTVPRHTHGLYCESLKKYDSLPPIASLSKQTEARDAFEPAAETISVPVQKPVGAPTTKIRTPLVLANAKPIVKKPYVRTTIDINYRKALEPKVMSPYHPSPGKTPRLIEIERKKRQYLSHNVSALVAEQIRYLFKNTHLSNLYDEDIASLLRSSKDVANGLPLEYFDDCDCDPRTVDDWLDVSTIPDDVESALQSTLINYPKQRGLASAICPAVISVYIRSDLQLLPSQPRRSTHMNGETVSSPRMTRKSICGKFSGACIMAQNLKTMQIRLSIPKMPFCLMSSTHRRIRAK
jgi:hypothetical protein